MKIYFKHPNGAEFSPNREPMERERFYTLVALAAFAMLLLTTLLWEVWR